METFKLGAECRTIDLVQRVSQEEALAVWRRYDRAAREADWFLGILGSTLKRPDGGKDIDLVAIQQYPHCGLDGFLSALHYYGFWEKTRTQLVGDLIIMIQGYDENTNYKIDLKVVRT